jgi:enoyl-CoA hydratase/carnithine racemase
MFTASSALRSLLKNDAYSKPIVAVVNGDCVDGGLELLLSTDILAPVPEARFALPESRRSIRSAAGYCTDTVENRGALRVW